MLGSDPQQTTRLKRRYRDLLKEITRLDSLSQGSVMPQPPHAWRCGDKGTDTLFRSFLASQSSAGDKGTDTLFRMSAPPL